jgi:hypothetical protein
MPTSITALRYNNLQARLADLYGNASTTGSLAAKSTGYGMPVRSGQVVGDFDSNAGSTDKVTAQQWLNLYLDITSCRVHQRASYTPTNFIPQTGVEKVDEQFLLSLEAAMTLAESEKDLSGTGTTTLDFVRDSTNNSISPTRTTNWNGTIAHEFTLTFGDFGDLHGCFNGGGYIAIDPSLTLPGSYNTKTLDWYYMLRDIGTININKDITDTTGTLNTVPTSGDGIYGLDTNWKILTSVTGASYAANEFRVRAKRPFDNVLQFSVEFRDLDTGTGTTAKGSQPIDEDVQGTLQCQVYLSKPSSTFTFNSGAYNAVNIPRPNGLNIKALQP